MGKGTAKVTTREATKPTITGSKRVTPRITTKANDVYDDLWKILPHPGGTVVRIFTRKGDSRDGDFAKSAAEIRQFARGHQDRNVYVAPNPSSSTLGARHSAKEVTHWSFFLIDMDPVCSCPPDRKPKQARCQTCRGKANPQAALDEALLWLGEWMGRDLTKGKPIIIDSGRGCQAWIRLEDVVLGEEGMDRAIPRRVSGYWLKRLDERLGLCHGCRIDTSVSDLPRVMRCPGTVNIKTGREAGFINLTDRVFVGLAKMLVVGTPEKALKDPAPPTNVEKGQSWQDVFVHLTLMAQKYITLGQEEPGRHKVCWHTAKKLQELGVTRTQARHALSWGNTRRGKDAELSREEIEHALDTAYGE